MIHTGAAVAAERPSGATEGAAEFTIATEPSLTLVPMRPRVLSGEEASQAWQRVLERLADPAQRAALRAEQRASVQATHEEVGAVLGIDPATAEQLVELLTDQQMKQLQRMHERAPLAMQDHRTWMQDTADEETRRLSAVRQLLGDEGFERYRQYSATLSERAQVSHFDERLDPSSKLLPEQKEQLIVVFHESNVRHTHASSSRGRARRVFAAQSMEELQRNAQLQTIAISEEMLRQMQEMHRFLAERAAHILTPAQSAVLSQINAEQASQQRWWIENKREQVGLSRTIRARVQEVEPTAPERTPLAGNVKFEITVKVNRAEPVTFSHVGQNGRPVTFELGDGLLLEATPMLYDDHWLEVHTAYYEQDSAGKRHIGGGNSGAQLQIRLPDGTSSAGFAGSSTMLVGRKGYAIETKEHAEPL